MKPKLNPTHSDNVHNISRDTFYSMYYRLPLLYYFTEKYMERKSILSAKWECQSAPFFFCGWKSLNWQKMLLAIPRLNQQNMRIAMTWWYCTIAKKKKRKLMIEIQIRRVHNFRVREYIKWRKRRRKKQMIICVMCCTAFAIKYRIFMVQRSKKSTRVKEMYGIKLSCDVKWSELSWA